MPPSDSAPSRQDPTAEVAQLRRSMVQHLTASGKLLKAVYDIDRDYFGSRFQSKNQDQGTNAFRDIEVATQVVETLSEELQGAAAFADSPVLRDHIANLIAGIEDLRGQVMIMEQSSLESVGLPADKVVMQARVFPENNPLACLEEATGFIRESHTWVVKTIERLKALRMMLQEAERARADAESSVKEISTEEITQALTSEIEARDLELRGLRKRAADLQDQVSSLSRSGSLAEGGLREEINRLNNEIETAADMVRSDQAEVRSLVVEIERLAANCEQEGREDGRDQVDDLIITVQVLRDAVQDRNSAIATLTTAADAVLREWFAWMNRREELNLEELAQTRAFVAKHEKAQDLAAKAGDAQRELDAMRSKAEGLAAELAKAQQQVSQQADLAKQQAEQAKQQAEQAKQQAEQAAAERARLTSELEQARKQAEAKAGEAGSVAQQAQAAANAAQAAASAAKSDVEKTRAEAAQAAQAAAAAAKEVGDRLSARERELEQAKAEVARLTKAEAEVRAANEKSSGRVAAAENEAKRLAQELEEAKGEVEVIQGAAEEAHAELKKIRTEAESTKANAERSATDAGKRAETASAEATRLRSEADEAKAAAAKANAALTAATNQQEALNKDLAVVRGRADAAEAKVTQAETAAKTAASEMERLRGALATAEKALSDARTSGDQAAKQAVATAQADVKKVSEALAAAQKDLASRTNELTAAKQALEAAQKDLAATKQTANQAAETAKAEIAAAKQAAERQAAEFANLRKENDAAKAEVKSAREAAEQRAKAAGGEAERLQSQVTELQAASGKARTEIERLSQELAKSSDGLKDRDRLSAELAQQKTAREGLERDLAAAQAKWQKAADELAQIKEQAAAASSRIDAAADEHISLISERDDLHKELAQLRTSAQQAAEQAAKVVAASDQELATVRGKVAELDQLRGAAAKERDEARARLDEMRRSTENLSSQASQKQDSLAKELQALRDAESQARQQVAASEGKVAQLTSRITAAEKELAQGKELQAKRQADVDRLSKEVATLHQTVRDREAALAKAAEDARASNAKLLREIEQLQGKVAGAENRERQTAQEREAWNRQKADADRDRTQLDERLKQSLAKVKDLTGEIESTKLVSTAAAGERDKLRREVERLQGDQSQLGKKIEERESQLTARLTETSRQLAELKQVSARLEGERDRARAEVERLEGERKKTADSRAREGTAVWAKRLADSAADHEELKTRAAALERKLGETKQREADLASQVARAEDRANAAQTKASQLERGRTAGSVAVGDASKRLAEMKSLLIEARAAVAQAKSWKDGMEAKVAELTKTDQSIIASLVEQVKALGGTPKI